MEKTKKAMINIWVAYDDQDRKVGHYYEASKIDLQNFLTPQKSNFQELYINSQNCHFAYLDIKLQNKLFEKFIFVAYSHGEEDTGKSLICQNNAYLDANNAHLFANSLVYAVACSVGKNLGKILIEKGCLAFIGFTEIIDVPKSDDRRYHSWFITCENSILKEFLTNDITIEEAFYRMKEVFTNNFKEIRKINYLLASFLQQNRDSLVLYGNRSLTRQDFV